MRRSNEGIDSADLYTSTTGPRRDGTPFWHPSPVGDHPLDLRVCPLDRAEVAALPGRENRAHRGPGSLRTSAKPGTSRALEGPASLGPQQLMHQFSDPANSADLAPRKRTTSRGGGRGRRASARGRSRRRAWSPCHPGCGTGSPPSTQSARAPVRLSCRARGGG